MQGEGPKLRNLSIGIKYKVKEHQQRKKIVITINTSGIDNIVMQVKLKVDKTQFKCNVPLVVVADWAACNIAV